MPRRDNLIHDVGICRKVNTLTMRFSTTDHGDACAHPQTDRRGSFWARERATSCCERQLVSWRV
jgi:hypothetical protein